MKNPRLRHQNQSRFWPCAIQPGSQPMKLAPRTDVDCASSSICGAATTNARAKNAAQPRHRAGVRLTSHRASAPPTRSSIRNGVRGRAASMPVMTPAAIRRRKERSWPRPCSSCHQSVQTRTARGNASKRPRWVVKSVVVAAHWNRRPRRRGRVVARQVRQQVGKRLPARTQVLEKVNEAQAAAEENKQRHNESGEDAPGQQQRPAVQQTEQGNAHQHVLKQHRGARLAPACTNWAR